MAREEFSLARGDCCQPALALRGALFHFDPDAIAFGPGLQDRPSQPFCGLQNLILILPEEIIGNRLALLHPNKQLSELKSTRVSCAIGQGCA